MLKKQTAFTLIELLIVVAILGILASIAYPSYLEYIHRSRRADAETVLLQGAQYMERIYTERGAYNKASSGAAATTLTGVGFPTTLTVAPAGGSNIYYTIALSGNLASDSFTLAATPTGQQANDKCGTLTLKNDGTRDVSGATLSASQCWLR